MYELDLPPKIGTWWTYCDMSQDGGGWTLLAKAVSRAESNNEKDWLRKGNWQDYTELGIGDADDTKSNVFWAPLELWADLFTLFPTNTVVWTDSLHSAPNEAPRLTNMKLDKDNMFQSSADSAANSIPLDEAVVKSKMRFTTRDHDNDI